MRFLRQSLAGLFLLFATLGLLILAVGGLRDAILLRLAEEGSGPPARESVFTVQVVEAKAERITPHLLTFGEIRSRRSLEIRAGAAGEVTAISENMTEGGQVQQGEVLLRVDPTEAQMAITRAEIDLQGAQAELRDAQRAAQLAQDELGAARRQAALRAQALARQKDLESRGVGRAAATETAELNASAADQAVLARRQAVIQGQSRVDRATIALQRARITLEDSNRQLGETTIEAAFTGTLAEVAVGLGRRIAMNERIATLVDGDDLEVAFRISTAAYGRLLDEAGAVRPSLVRVSLDVAGIDLVASGQVSRSSGAAGAEQTGRLLFAHIEAPQGLKPGDFVSVQLHEPPLDGVIRLPAAALDPQGRVLVLGADNRLQAVAVGVLRYLENDILVQAPDLAGREVVMQRTPLLGPGIKVKPLREGGAKGDAQNIAAESAGEAPGGSIVESPGGSPDEPLVELSDARRQRLVQFVQQNKELRSDVRQRLLEALAQPKVAAPLVRRLETRLDG
ncbi:MAG: efflux transporter periplasmic adaptor subunit [Rhodobacteraceae bacterium]|nr:efflux transporter periplasmic adaptor subunit [Paracoccaceae bacterium]